MQYSSNDKNIAKTVFEDNRIISFQLLCKDVNVTVTKSQHNRYNSIITPQEFLYNFI